MSIMKHLPRRATVKRLQDPRTPLPYRQFHPEWGMTYQKCRFCERGLREVPGLYRYGLHHNLCAECLEQIQKSHPGSHRV